MFINDAVIEHWATLGNDALSAPPAIVSATISSGESLSTVATVPDGYRAVGVALPDAWTDSSLSLQISFDNASWFEVTNGNLDPLPAELTGAKASYSVYLPVWNLFRASYLRIRSGTLLSPTTQDADRALLIICLKCNAADR
jgi:hypothetical protein